MFRWSLLERARERRKHRKLFKNQTTRFFWMQRLHFRH